MAKRDHAALDAAVLAAVRGAGQYDATYVIRNRMHQALRPQGCAPVLAALRRLERAGKVRLARRQPYARMLSWELTDLPT